MAAAEGLKKGDHVEAEVASLTFQGRGVARVGRLALFVQGGLPGDVVRVRLTKVKRSYGEGEATALIRASSWRVAPRCRHFGACGGCTLQDLVYPMQLEQKARQVADALAHIGGLEADVRPALGMDDPWHYRNKMEFAFGQRASMPYVGLLHRGSFYAVEETHECHLATARAMEVVRAVERWAVSAGWTAYDVRTRNGLLRHLVIREGLRTGDLMVNLVTTSGAAPSPSLVSAVEGMHPTAVLWSHNDGLGAAVRADRMHVLAGAESIEERIDGMRLSFGPFSFLQTNSIMTEVLYRQVAELAGLTGRETVLDLYCGVGAIGLYLAQRARQVVGVEVQPEAVAFARRNAEMNRVTNVRFERARVEHMSTLSFGVIAPDVVVTDPPRAGMHPRLVSTLCDLRAARLVYVSCNPAALARDLKALSVVYEVGAVQPVDLFPHTWHIETVASLRLR